MFEAFSGGARPRLSRPYGFAPLPPERGIWAGVPRSPKTPMRALYLASSFAGSGGFTGAILSGANAARMAMAASSI